MQGYRAGRIRQMLNEKPKWKADDFRRMQTDAYAPQADRLLPALFGALAGAKLDERERQALEKLKSWDRVAAIDSVGASIFYATYREAWQLALDDDVSELFSRLVKVFTFTYGFFDRLWAEAPTAKVWDVKGTPTVENRDDVLRQAFTRAVANLGRKLGADQRKWTWGRLHTITFRHTFGKSVPGAAFDVGPAPLAGSWDTVWAAGFGFWDPDYMFEDGEGPAFRHILDFSKPEECSMVLDLGQSGWPLTKQYSNAVEDWKAGRLWPLSMDREVYGRDAEGTLTLLP
jgi:penicillin amidase